MTKTNEEWAQRVIRIIRSGKVDEHLNDIAFTMKRRRERAGELKFDQIKVGTRVRFNRVTRPQRMIGLEGTVVEKKLKKIVVEVEGHRRITAPMALIDIVE